MYTIEKHVNLNPAKDYWLSMAFQDAALLHAFIFCADGTPPSHKAGKNDQLL